MRAFNLFVVRIFIFLYLLFFMSGCLSIMQYQRQYLGDPIMYFGHDAEEGSLKSHIYPRREGSSGGDGGAGGGCGC